MVGLERKDTLCLHLELGFCNRMKFDPALRKAYFGLLSLRFSHTKTKIILNFFVEST